jgi:3-hydroxyacyl-[acyl-carrier-protein] dehydratase
MSLFKEQFYSIISMSHTENEFNFTIRINANHAIFNGHFPGNPVTPGVVQMEIIKELLSEGLGKTVQLLSMSNCKYLAILNPNECGNIEINIAPTEQENGSLKAVISIKNDEITFLKAVGVYL